MLSRNDFVCRQAHLFRGIFPLYYDKDRKNTWADDLDARLDFALKAGKDMGFIKTGSFIIFVSGWAPGSHTTNTMRVLQVTEDSFIGRGNEAQILFG